MFITEPFIYVDLSFLPILDINIGKLCVKVQQGLSKNANTDCLVFFSSEDCKTFYGRHIYNHYFRYYLVYDGLGTFN